MVEKHKAASAFLKYLDIIEYQNHFFYIQE